MFSQDPIIQERSSIIQINKNLSTPIKNKNKNDNKKDNKSEYSLKYHVFDPTKNSPPNAFMNKLKERMNIYN
jgi:hypothetical protein